ncbi:MAG: LapA family protein [Ilumatobacteraceae bacterium]
MTEYSTRDRDREPVQSGRSGPSPTLIALIVIAIAALIFVLANRDTIDVSFWAFQVKAQTWVAIVIALGLGVLLDRLVTAWWRRRS